MTEEFASGELVDTTKQLDEAYGYYLEIDARGYRTIKDVKLQGAKHWSEVKVVFSGMSKEFTFTEFMQALGFPFDDTGIE